MNKTYDELQDELHICHERIAELEASVKGPDGFATWKDAAVDERVRRAAAEGREQALSASLERILDAWMYDDTGIHDNHGHGVMLPTARYQGVNQAIMDSRLKGVSLKKLVLIKQAEAFEAAERHMICKEDARTMRINGHDLRQQAD